MKLLNILLENQQLEDSIIKALKAIYDCDDIHVSTGDYAGGREDSDPLKGVSFGKVNFLQRGEFEDSVWNQMLEKIKSLGLEITQESNSYEREIGERDYYPHIKFHFKKN